MQRKIKQPSLIKNKIKRLQVLYKKKIESNRLKKKIKKSKKSSNQKQIPITIQDKRQIDQNLLFQQQPQLLQQENIDQFSSILNGKQTPKVLMTSSQNPSVKLFQFMKQIKLLLPDCHYYPKKNYSFQQICSYSSNQGYTHALVWRQDNALIHQVIIAKLPKGPQATFRITSISLNKQIYHHATWTQHIPQLIIQNFNTILGRKIGRLFASLFPQTPEFTGRRIITFRNQRDFIFMRHHRYQFDDNGKRVNLQQIGPRITFKLKHFEKGLHRDSQTEWKCSNRMYIKRNKFYL